MSNNDFNNGNQSDFFNDQQPEEELGVPLTILSFCIPLAGIIIYFSNKGRSPKKANTACYAALAGMVLGVVIRVITMAASH
ncbi:hypothetical protein AAFN85_18400 [Mucilaginibacter sp. CAU 1740]|uniref:hypothetical protein n=1 Tax=Mucilaginibacter sp. CAU 1740 TaxID=3140365 RepID=UPI00325C2F56